MLQRRTARTCGRPHRRRLSPCRCCRSVSCAAAAYSPSCAPCKCARACAHTLRTLTPASADADLRARKANPRRERTRAAPAPRGPHTCRAEQLVARALPAARPLQAPSRMPRARVRRRQRRPNVSDVGQPSPLITRRGEDQSRCQLSGNVL